MDRPAPLDATRRKIDLSHRPGGSPADHASGHIASGKERLWSPELAHGGH